MIVITVPDGEGHTREPDQQHRNSIYTTSYKINCKRYIICVESCKLERYTTAVMLLRASLWSRRVLGIRCKMSSPDFELGSLNIAKIEY